MAAAAIPEILILAWAAYALKTRLKDARHLTLFLNLFSAALIAIPLAEIISTKTPSMARATARDRALPSGCQAVLGAFAGHLLHHS